MRWRIAEFAVKFHSEKRRISDITEYRPPPGVFHPSSGQRRRVIGIIVVAGQQQPVESGPVRTQMLHIVAVIRLLADRAFGVNPVPQKFAYKTVRRLRFRISGRNGQHIPLNASQRLSSDRKR